MSITSWWTTESDRYRMFVVCLYRLGKNIFRTPNAEFHDGHSNSIIDFSCGRYPDRICEFLFERFTGKT